MDDVLMRIRLGGPSPASGDDDCGFAVAWESDAATFSRIWGVPESTFHRGFTSCTTPDDLARRQAVLVPRGGGAAVGVGLAWRNDDPEASGGEVGWVHSLKVDEAWHGRGLAKVLLAAILGRLAGE
jgi:GNAT superfamily N-acetyltransferase